MAGEVKKKSYIFVKEGKMTLTFPRFRCSSLTAMVPKQICLERERERERKRGRDRDRDRQTERRERERERQGQRQRQRQRQTDREERERDNIIRKKENRKQEGGQINAVTPVVHATLRSHKVMFDQNCMAQSG